MRINTRLHRGVLVVTPKERLTIETEAQFTQAMRALFDGGPRRIALDLVDVPYVDSMGLGAIVQAYTSARRRGGDLKLLRVSSRIGRLLSITRLCTVLKAYDSEEEMEGSFDVDGDAGCPHSDILLGPAPLRV